MDDFKELSEKAREHKETINLYNENDIVYLIPTPDSSREWPSIGSKHEIDLKVISVYKASRPIYLDDNTTKTDWRYNLISGYGQELSSVNETQLVSARERSKYFETLILNEDTELAPKGTQFTKSNGYYSNEIIGIHISLEKMETIKHLFTIKI